MEFFYFRFKNTHNPASMKIPSSTSLVLFIVLYLNGVVAPTHTTAQIRNKRYVMAPNGLSLRAENTLKSERMAVMPLGSEVTLLEVASDSSMVVEQIKGGMEKVAFKELVGYCFSGYLSQLPLPKKGLSVKAYVDTLKKDFPMATFEQKSNNPDFHEGNTDTFILPTTAWHEAYYTVHALYHLPKALGFPNPLGPAEEEVEEPNKTDDVWYSSLKIHRTANALTRISYYYRVEGYGYTISIAPNESGFFTVEHVEFVD